jgi:3-isopropylmalate dehydrogenase
MAAEADLIDAAIANTLGKGLRTADIMQDGMTEVSTTQIGEAIIGELKAAGEAAGSNKPQRRG